MDVVFHRRAQRCVDQAVTRERVVAGKTVRHDGDGKVPAAAACAGVSGVPLAVVHHLQVRRRERFAQLRLDGGDAVPVQGSTLRKGCTLTSRYTPASM